MSIFANMSSTGLEESQDSLGGFSLLESDIYEATIKALYATTAKSGAMALNIVADINGREYRETVYVTNKEGQNFFVKSNKKIPLPGFVTINDLCLCGIGKELSELDTEEKVVNIYNVEQKKEVPTPVPMIVEMIGAKVALGIHKETVNKRVLSGDTYVESNETREQNRINKVFDLESHKTVHEGKAGAEATFWDKWLEKYKGKTLDRAKKGDSAPKAAPAATAPRKSLFGK